MDTNSYKLIIDNMKENSQKLFPNFNEFKTEFGLDFQKNFINLMGFAIIGILIQGIPEMEEIYIRIFSEIGKEIPIEMVIKSFTDESLTSEEIQIFKEKFFDKLQSIELVNDFEDNNSQSSLLDVLSLSERINSYFIISLYAYIDLYSLSLYQHVLSSLKSTEIYDFNKEFKHNGDPKERINIITNYLRFTNRELMKEFLANTTWETTIDKLKGIRDYTAHKDPLLKLQKLICEISNIDEKANSKIKSLKELIDSRLIQFEKYDELKKFLVKTEKMFESILQILFILFEIGKDCYYYLALIDIQISNFYNKKLK